MSTQIERRYEFFISSTFEDLREERRFAQETIIVNKHIPVGMELFDAGFEPQWNVIQRAIDDCDYYLLIVAGRYGSLDPSDGTSYTEKEFNYAQAQGKPIIVFMLSERGLERWEPGRIEKKEENRARLAAFRERLSRTGLVEFWEDTADLKRLLQTRLFSLVRRYPSSGWVRASKYEEVGFKRDVYTYLFNQLNPFDDVKVTEQFITSLDRPLTTIDNVLLALRQLIKDFVTKRVRPPVRVYFAFKLLRPVPMLANPFLDQAQDPALPRPPAVPAQYCLGISSERHYPANPEEEAKESPWMEGYLIGKASNTHEVFRQKKILTVKDARKPGTPGRAQNNQVVPEEGSVIGTPVLYGRTRGSRELYSIGVVGLSSPRPHELDTEWYREFAEELQSLFSAMFYAYAQAIEREEGSRVDEARMAERLRREIARHYENLFGGNYPNVARGDVQLPDASGEAEPA